MYTVHEPHTPCFIKPNHILTSSYFDNHKFKFHSMHTLIMFTVTTKQILTFVSIANKWCNAMMSRKCQPNKQK